VDVEARMSDQAGLVRGVVSSDTSSADEALARRISAGEVAAWDVFFDRYASWAYRFAYQHLGSNRADAEDLCSDILMTAAKCIRRYDASRGALDVWLLGIARHRLARFCRRRRWEVPLMPDTAEAGANPEQVIPVPSVDASLTRQIVNRALASLPQRQAAVLVGKYVVGYTVEELARSHDITPKAVESLLSRARAAFRSSFRSLTEGVSGGDRGG
jgi:RNA polymerase sigma-70 factor (ECF subfamily)